MLYLGIDGGGSKTAFCLADAGGCVRAMIHLPALDYQQIGYKVFTERLKEGTACALREAGSDSSQLAGVTVGVPNFGEIEEDSVRLEALTRGVFSGTVSVSVVNDVFAAMYGAIKGQSGICILSGTGSMSMGMDASGRVERAGGWGHFCSDEGSCYWLGRQAMHLFVRQADGIEPKSALYDIVMQTYKLNSPFEFLSVVKQLQDKRNAVAAFQLILLAAARSGDERARDLYQQAAQKLSELVYTVRSKLSFPPDKAVPVAYAGGAFKTGELLLAPLRTAVARKGMTLAEPALIPAAGAVLHAILRCSGTGDDGIIAALASSAQKPAKEIL